MLHTRSITITAALRTTKLTSALPSSFLLAHDWNTLSPTPHRPILGLHHRVFSSSHQPRTQHGSLLATLRNDVSAYKNVSKDLLHKKYTDAYSFYEQFSHMDEVREAHDKVITIQDELHLAQKRRCDLMAELIGIRSKQQLISGEMSNSSKSDYRYLELVKMSIESNQVEKEKLEAYQIEDSQERSLFSHLMAAVKASHEKEKIYANTVKYWSIIGSLLSAALGALGAALSYHYRQNTYKTMTDQYTEQVTHINTHVDAMKHELTELKHEIKSARLTMQRDADRSAKLRIVPGPATSRSTESWSGFLWRKTVDVYRYMVPRRDGTVNVVHVAHNTVSGHETA